MTDTVKVLDKQGQQKLPWKARTSEGLQMDAGHDYYCTLCNKNVDDINVHIRTSKHIGNAAAKSERPERPQSVASTGSRESRRNQLNFAPPSLLSTRGDNHIHGGRSP